MADIIPDDQFIPDQPAQQSGTSGQFIPDSQFKSDEDALQEKYGTPEQQVKAGVEGLAKGVAGPLATAAEVRGMGVNPEDILGREEANPITHYGSEIAGLTVGPFGKALGAAGGAGAAALGLEGAAGTAAKLGLENALYAIGDETSKSLLNNPASIQAAAAHVGLSGLLGAGLGLGLGKVGELWKAKVGPEADSFVSDFADRLKAHAEGTLPTAENVGEELSNEFRNVEAAKTDLRGIEGLKAHEISQIMPQVMRPEMVEQANSVLKGADEILSKAEAEPGIYQGSRLPALRDYAGRLATTLADPELTPYKIYTAVDDFKKGLGSLKKWDLGMSETEKPTASLMGELYHDVRTSLEDPSVWGKAGERQAAINQVWTEHLPAAKDFARTFTEQVEGEPLVSPAKVNTLMNGLGKPNAEIRLDKLTNYLEANDKLYKELDKIHSNLEIENPYKRPALTNTKSILGNLSPGMKTADFVQKQAANAASEAIASGAGVIAGKLSGLPGGEYAGYLFGHYAVKPFLKTIMPTLVNPLLKAGASGAGMKAAVDAITATAKGESLLAKSTEALFQVGGGAAVKELIPDKEKLEKLEKSLDLLSKSPESIGNVGGNLDHYMPEHATALAAMVQGAANYLKTQKPEDIQAGVLDRPIAPSAEKEANYKAALEIAESPLSILAHVYKGTLMPNHMTHLNNLYPALAPTIVQSVTNAMLGHLSQDDIVPFKMRGSLSRLIGQPMDSSFNQPNIAAAQATFVAAQRPPMPSGVKKGTKALGKTAELHQTPSDARQKALNKA